MVPNFCAYIKTCHSDIFRLNVVVSCHKHTVKVKDLELWRSMIHPAHAQCWHERFGAVLDQSVFEKNGQLTSNLEF